MTVIDTRLRYAASEKSRPRSEIEVAQAELILVSHLKTLDVGEAILVEGREADVLGTVLKGVLRISKVLPDGRRSIVGFVHPGESFGEPFVAVCEYSYEAATEAQVRIKYRGTFERILSEHPEFEHQVMLSAFTELSEAREHAVRLGCQSAMQRLASYLLAILDRREDRLGELLVVGHKRIAYSAVSRSDLASYLNTTIETISRMLHLLQNEGVVRIIDAQHFEIIDVPALVEVAGYMGESRQPPRAKQAVTW